MGLRQLAIRIRAICLLVFFWSAGIAAVAADVVPEEILENLKAAEFKTREKAENGLLEWSRKDPASRVRLIFKQARDYPDPEVRQRSHNVLFTLAMDDYFREGEGFVGIQMIALHAEIPGEEQDGAKEVIAITRVLRDTPARDAGLRVGDMILSVDEENLAGEGALPSFQRIIREMKPGKLTRFGIIRDGELIDIDLKLGRRPPVPQNARFGQPMEDMNELAKRDQERFFKGWLKKLDQ